MQNTKRWLMRTGTGVAISAFALAGGLGAHDAHASGGIQGDGQITPKFTTDGGVSGFRTANTVPYWSSSFNYGGKTYPYTMVGTNPLTNTSTTVPMVIVPLKFTFSPTSNYLGENWSDVRDPFTVGPSTGLNSVQQMIASPIF